MTLRDRLATLVRLFVLFTVLVAIGLISAITTIRLTIRGHQENMPNLVGMQVEIAERVLNARGLVLKVEDKLFSPQYPANDIVSQIPPPGTRLKMGQHVHVIVSLGSPRVSVPKLVGGSLRAARITAVQGGLTLGDVAVVHWSDAVQDQVIVQDPPPAVTEMHSPAVNLLVSLGDAPEAFLCPSLIGRPVSETRRILEKAGFKVQAVTPIPTDATPRGTILAQSPPAGSKIGRDTEFNFQVAQ
jgi:eukaryotic-like serine/threonine-protein kinase